jgi:hypothetical protein
MKRILQVIFLILFITFFIVSNSYSSIKDKQEPRTGKAMNAENIAYTFSIAAMGHKDKIK